PPPTSFKDGPLCAVVSEVSPTAPPDTGFGGGCTAPVDMPRPRSASGPSGAGFPSDVPPGPPDTGFPDTPPPVCGAEPTDPAEAPPTPAGDFAIRSEPAARMS